MAAGACRRRLPPARARNAAPVHRVKEWEERAAAPARVSPFPVCVLTRGVVLGTRVCTYSTRTASSVQYRACLKSPSRTTPALRATRKGMGKGCGPPYRAAPQHPPSLRTRPTRRGRPTCGRRSHRSHANRLASILAWTRPAGGGGGGGGTTGRQFTPLAVRRPTRPQGEGTTHQGWCQRREGMAVGGGGMYTLLPAGPAAVPPLRGAPLRPLPPTGRPAMCACGRDTRKHTHPRAPSPLSTVHTIV